MKLGSIYLSLAIVVFGCGCSGQSPTPNNAEKPANSAAVASPPAQTRVCTALSSPDSNTLRPGWKITGTLAVTAVDGVPILLEAKDATGKVITSKNLKELKNGKEYGEAILQATCDAGGVLRSREKNPADPKNGVTTVDIFGPEKEDETSDLKLLCAPPSFFPDLTLSDAIADLSGEISAMRWLTSYRFRLWNLETFATLDKSTLATPYQFEPLYARADELEKIAKDAGFSSCGYVDAIRRIKQATTPPPSLLE